MADFFKSLLFIGCHKSWLLIGEYITNNRGGLENYSAVAVNRLGQLAHSTGTVKIFTLSFEHTHPANTAEPDQR